MTFLKTVAILLLYWKMVNWARGTYIFQKSMSCFKILRQKDNTNHISYRGPTNIRCHHTKSSDPLDLAPWICVPWNCATSCMILLVDIFSCIMGYSWKFYLIRTDFSVWSPAGFHYDKWHIWLVGVHQDLVDPDEDSLQNVGYCFHFYMIRYLRRIISIKLCESFRSCLATITCMLTFFVWFYFQRLWMPYTKW